MSYQTIKFEKADNLITITLNRPDEANGVNHQMADELADAALKCSADASVKAVILTGEGRFFCAGGDVKAMKACGDDLPAELKRLADTLHMAISSFSRMDAPVIVAVNGMAAGAGFSLAIAGDLVVASKAAGFTMAYTTVGLCPDGAGSYFLPRLVGLRKAQEIIYTNKMLSADEAFEWGLVNSVVESEQLMDEALKFAEHFLNGSADSNAAVKNLLQHSFTNDLETQMALEARSISACSKTENGKEGINAFNERRKPVFSR